LCLEWQRKGIGSFLQVELEKIAKSMGIQEIMLDIYCNNEGSQQAHTAWGFSPLLQIHSKKL
jgi:hypothetical protein